MGTLTEKYLWELRRTLGRRLPSAVLAARLREAEGHLRMAAAEHGEAEALRRYGAVRNVAHSIVRAHRGYETAKASRLALGYGLALFGLGTLQALGSRYGADAFSTLTIRSLQAASLILAVSFVGRVAKTRRWLATPMILWHGAVLLLIAGASLIWPSTVVAEIRDGRTLTRRPTLQEARQIAARRDIGRERVLLAQGLLTGSVFITSVWTLLNASALGFASLADRRRVRKA